MTVMTAVQGRQIDELMERVSDALRHVRYFEAERMAVKALVMARQAGDFTRLAAIVLPLQEARRQRVQQAMDAADRVRIVGEAVSEQAWIEPGAYLVEPPLVGADARKLRIRALQCESPALVLCREPKTRLGRWPLVALGRYAVRTHVEPPAKPKAPDMAWLLAGVEELGDAAIESVDPALRGERRVDAFLELLDALPEHEKLHQRLEEAAREAARAAAAAEAQG